MSDVRVLAFLALFAGFSNGQASDWSYLDLLKHLNLTPANDVLTIMRPVKNWTTSTLVEVDLLMYGILHVDEKSQTVTSHIWIQMRWTNEFLTWNPSDFRGINNLIVPRSRLWIPDISIQEDASDAGTTQQCLYVNLFCNGWVFSAARQRLTSTCQLNLFLFPFDTQQCNITIYPMVSAEESIKLGTISNNTMLYEVSEQYMVTQGEWRLKNLEVVEISSARTNRSQSKLTYRITIVRKPMLYMINLIVPLLFFLLLDLASFFISDATGEKLNFKVTILLSISVLLLILQDMLPSTEDQLPMIASYCVAIFTLVGISVLEAMLLGFLTDLDGYSDGKAQSSVSAQVDVQLEADHHKEPAGAEEGGQVKPDSTRPPPAGPSGRHLLRLILEEVQAARQEAARPNKETKPGYYKKVAEIIDSVFFVLYFLTVVVFLILMYTGWVINYTS